MMTKHQVYIPHLAPTKMPAQECTKVITMEFVQILITVDLALYWSLYDGYWSNNNFNDDKVGIDVGASLMIVPGLEYRIGYAHNESIMLVKMII